MQPRHCMCYLPRRKEKRQGARKSYLQGLQRVEWSVASCAASGLRPCATGLLLFFVLCTTPIARRCPIGHCTWSDVQLSAPLRRCQVPSCHNDVVNKAYHKRECS
jgi:hypothetical protein